MLEGVWNLVKGLFVKPDGGINWRTIIGMGAGAAIGGMGLLPGVLGQDAATAALLGGGIGLAGSAVIGMFMPDSAPAAGVPAVPAGPGIAPPSPGVQLSPSQTPGMGPQPGGRGPGG